MKLILLTLVTAALATAQNVTSTATDPAATGAPVVHTINPTDPVPSHKVTHSVPDSDETCSPVTITVTGGLLPSGSLPVVSATPIPDDPLPSGSLPVVSATPIPDDPLSSGSWPVVSATPMQSGPPYPTAPHHQTGVTPSGTAPTGTVSLPIVTPSGTAPGTGVLPPSSSPSTTPPPDFTAAAVAINAPAVYAGILGLAAYLF